MLIYFLRSLDPLVTLFFFFFYFFFDVIANNFFLIKRILLLIAFFSLGFIFFPSIRKDFGNFAEMMLLGILFLSPLSKIFRIRLFSQLMGLRREFGILMGCFAFVHGIAYFIDPTSFSLSIEPYLNAHFFLMHPLFYFGIITLIFTLPLLLTSNSISIRLLGGRRWKMLHRFVYVILITMLLHIFFLKTINHGSDIVTLIQSVSIVLGYILMKVLAWKNFLPFLRETISYIETRYKTFILDQKS